MKRFICTAVLLSAGCNPVIALAVGLSCGPTIIDFIDDQVRKLG